MRDLKDAASTANAAVQVLQFSGHNHNRLLIFKFCDILLSAFAFFLMAAVASILTAGGKKKLFIIHLICGVLTKKKNVDLYSFSPFIHLLCVLKSGNYKWDFYNFAH